MRGLKTKLHHYQRGAWLGYYSDGDFIPFDDAMGRLVADGFPVFEITGSRHSQARGSD
jgi:hypothetical protein